MICRTLIRYTRYSGVNPELIDGDVFRIVVPLDIHHSGRNEKENIIKREGSDKTGDWETID